MYSLVCFFSEYKKKQGWNVHNVRIWKHFGSVISIRFGAFYLGKLLCYTFQTGSIELNDVLINITFLMYSYHCHWTSSSAYILALYCRSFPMWILKYSITLMCVLNILLQWFLIYFSINFIFSRILQLRAKIIDILLLHWQYQQCCRSLRHCRIFYFTNNVFILLLTLLFSHPFSCLQFYWPNLFAACRLSTVPIHLAWARAWDTLNLPGSCLHYYIKPKWMNVCTRLF